MKTLVCILVLLSSTGLPAAASTVQPGSFLEWSNFDINLDHFEIATDDGFFINGTFACCVEQSIVEDFLYIDFFKSGGDAYPTAVSPPYDFSLINGIDDSLVLDFRGIPSKVPAPAVGQTVVTGPFIFMGELHGGSPNTQTPLLYEFGGQGTYTVTIYEGPNGEYRGVMGVRYDFEAVPPDNPADVPEPSTILLVGVGLLLNARLCRQRRRLGR